MKTLDTQFLRRIWLSLMLLVFVAGCDYYGINTAGEITKDPASFEKREVKLRGTVKPMLKIPFVDAMAYTLQDATGEVVVWAGTMPKEGDEVIVRGRVESLMILSGQSFGFAVKEIERKPAGMKLPWL